MNIIIRGIDNEWRVQDLSFDWKHLYGSLLAKMTLL